MGKGTDFRGYIGAKIKESVNYVFTNGKFPHERSVVGNPRMLMHGQ